MADSIWAGPAIKTALQFVMRNFVKRSEIFFHRGGGGRREISRYAVQFAAVAGGKNERLFQDSTLFQFVRGLQSLLRSKHNPLAQLDGRGAMIAADQRHLNADRAGAVRVGDSRHQRNRWN